MLKSHRSFRLSLPVAVGFVFAASTLPLFPIPALLSGQAADSPPSSTAAEKAQSLRITFLPPPLEGTLSLGVYDRNGKLVRSLHVEAMTADFTISLNGLSTNWDGKDDAGRSLPSGKYRVKGFSVGDIELTGEAYHSNDWVESEDGPRPVAFHGIKVAGDVLELTASDLNGAFWKITESLSKPDDAPSFKSIPRPKNPTEAPEPTSCQGRNGTRWSIEKVLGETVVIQFNSGGEVLRRLNIGAGQPLPVAIAASATAEEVFLLEQDGERWRVRALRRKPPAEAANGSTENSAPEAAAPMWDTFLEKSRWPCAKFSDASTRVGRPKAFAAEASIAIKPQLNPYLGGTTADIQLAAGFDEAGSFLKTSDGLVLRRLTDTQQLRWAVLGRDARQPAIVFLQSDGAVVEEYRVLQPGALMVFDAGDYHWPPK